MNVHIIRLKELNDVLIKLKELNGVHIIKLKELNEYGAYIQLQGRLLSQLHQMGSLPHICILPHPGGTLRQSAVCMSQTECHMSN